MKEPKFPIEQIFRTPKEVAILDAAAREQRLDVRYTQLKRNRRNKDRPIVAPSDNR